MTEPEAGVTVCLDCGLVLPVGTASPCPTCGSSRREHRAQAGGAEATAVAPPPDRIEIGFLTVLAPAWRYALQPHLAALAEISDARRTGAPSVTTADPELDVHDRESGHSAATIIIAVALVESVAVGDAVREEKIAEVMKDPCAYLASISELARLEAEMEEAFVLRNIVAHDHIWVISSGEVFAPDGSGSHRLMLDAEHRAGYAKGERWERVVDMGSRTTRPHGLPILPTAIGSAAAARVLVTVAEAVDALRLARPGPAGEMRIGYRDRKWDPLLDVAHRFLAEVT